MVNGQQSQLQWNHNEQARKQRELGCGFALYGWDGSTGRTVHYNRHRYYDPQVGRFISKDPISYAAG